MTLIMDAASITLGERKFNFSLTASTGEVHAILGKSGSGKSTLLNLVGGFLKPNSGNITWHGESLLRLTADKRPVTTLFQNHNLFDHLTVKQNIALGVSPKLRLNPSQWATVNTVLDDVGLPNRGENYPNQLSGGEQQRVGLARCLLRNRPVLLLDEPYGALDEATRNDMLTLTQDVINKNNLCVLMVTHNADDAQFLNATQHKLVDGTLID